MERFPLIVAVTAACLIGLLGYAFGSLVVPLTKLSSSMPVHASLGSYGSLSGSVVPALPSRRGTGTESSKSCISHATSAVSAGYQAQFGV